MSKIKYIILIVIIASIYFILALNLPFLSKKNKSNILLTESIVIHNSNNKWKFLTQKEIEDIDFVNTYVYNYKNEFIEKVNLKYSKKWLVKKGIKYIDYNNFTFAYNGLNNAKVIPFYREEATEEQRNILNTFMKQYKRTELDNDFGVFAIEANIDNDIDNEIIFEVSNLSIDSPTYDNYSMIVIYDNNEYYVLDTLNVNSLQMSSLYSLMLYKIIDIDGDGICEFITIDSPYSEVSDLKYSMYQKNNDKYELLITNREGE